MWHLLSLRFDEQVRTGITLDSCVIMKNGAVTAQFADATELVIVGQRG